MRQEALPWTPFGVAYAEREGHHHAVSDGLLHRCPKCGLDLSLADFASAPSLLPIGMLVDDEPARHLFFFVHVTESCGTTLTVPAERFAPLLTKPPPGDSLLGTDACSERCAHVDDLRLCIRACRWAPFRRLLVKLRQARAPA